MNLINCPSESSQSSTIKMLFKTKKSKFTCVPFKGGGSEDEKIPEMDNYGCRKGIAEYLLSLLFVKLGST